MKISVWARLDSFGEIEKMVEPDGGLNGMGWRPFRESPLRWAEEKMELPHNSLLAAAYAFEAANGKPLTSEERRSVEAAGFSSVPPDDLAEQVWKAVQQSDSSDYRATGYWALGKLARKNDEKRFLNALKRELDEDIRVAYQVMIALDNLGEPIFSRRGVGLDEDEQNRQDATIYLQSKI